MPEARNGARRIGLPAGGDLVDWARTGNLTVELGRLFRFGIVGIVATLVYPAVSLAVVWSGFFGAIGATIVGHIAAGLFSYFGHLRLSFGVAPRHRVFLGRFLAVAAAMFTLNLAITWLFTVVLGLSSVVSIATVAVLIPIVNYLLSRFWIFLPGLTPPADGRERVR